MVLSNVNSIKRIVLQFHWWFRILLPSWKTSHHSKVCPRIYKRQRRHWCTSPAEKKNCQLRSHSLSLKRNSSISHLLGNGPYPWTGWVLKLIVFLILPSSQKNENDKVQKRRFMFGVNLCNCAYFAVLRIDSVFLMTLQEVEEIASTTEETAGLTNEFSWHLLSFAGYERGNQNRVRLAWGTRQRNCPNTAIPEGHNYKLILDLRMGILPRNLERDAV